MVLCEKILNKEIKNNFEAYFYTLNQGHISHHADEEIRRMKKENLISYNGKTPLVNYDQVIKNKRKIEFEV